MHALLHNVGGGCSEGNLLAALMAANKRHAYLIIIRFQEPVQQIFPGFQLHVDFAQQLQAAILAGGIRLGFRVERAVLWLCGGAWCEAQAQHGCEHVPAGKRCNALGRVQASCAHIARLQANRQTCTCSHLAQSAKVRSSAIFKPFSSMTALSWLMRSLMQRRNVSATSRLNWSAGAPCSSCPASSTVNASCRCNKKLQLLQLGMAQPTAWCTAAGHSW